MPSLIAIQAAEISCDFVIPSAMKSCEGALIRRADVLVCCKWYAVMAIYHFSAKVISRAVGSSAVAAAAYRSADRLHDERSEESRVGKECVSTFRSRWSP